MEGGSVLQGGSWFYLTRQQGKVLFLTLIKRKEGPRSKALDVMVFKGAVCSVKLIAFLKACIITNLSKANDLNFRNGKGIPAAVKSSTKREGEIEKKASVQIGINHQVAKSNEPETFQFCTLFKVFLFCIFLPHPIVTCSWPPGAINIMVNLQCFWLTKYMLVIIL